MDQTVVTAEQRRRFATFGLTEDDLSLLRGLAGFARERLPGLLSEWNARFAAWPEIQDEEGSEWPSRDAARAHAMRILADIARDEARRQDRLHLFVTIRDQYRAVLAIASLAVACTWLD